MSKTKNIEFFEKNRQKEATSRARFVCPPAFAEIIPVINSITDEMIEQYSGIDERYSEYPLDWADVFAKLPETVKDYLLKTMLEKGKSKLLPFDIRRCIGIFRDVIAFRNLIRLIEVAARKYSRETGANEELTPEIIDEINTALSNFINPRVQDVLDDPSLENDLGIIGLRAAPNFRLRLNPPPLIAVLDDIDMKRIRRCEFCGNIFWADRIDALGCSRRCSNGLRQRRLREASKATPVEVVAATADDEEYSDIEFPIRL